MNDSIIASLKEKKIEFKSLENLDPLIESIKNKKIVMLGEASHGTHEYYVWRAKITKKLIEDHDFNFISVEGDWPPCFLLNRHIKNYKDVSDDTHEVLKNFERWPSWMWANWEVYELAEWLKKYNSKQASNKKAGFYGLDVYSLWESLDAIRDYLKKEDPSALETALKAMRCFEPHRGDDGQRYAYSTRLVPEGCSSEVNKMLMEILNKSPTYNSDKEYVLSTEQNAIVTKNAEEYYRVMMQGGASTWNLRDQHMMDTLNRLIKFHGDNSKAIVWAHNTHIGDASYTDMAEEGLFNIGELAREEYGRDQVSLIGFGSNSGSVLAGSGWGQSVQKMDLPSGITDSWENLCHQCGKQFFVFSDDLKEEPYLQKFIPHRAVGVVYNPNQEKYGNYVPTIIPERYDAFVFFDQSSALNDINIKTSDKKMPNTYPFGL